jgi:two-component system CheB/CheR fusion protein
VDTPSTSDGTQHAPRGVVGVGASAGGLEALTQLFQAMPAKTGLAFVVVQHLSPDHKSLMGDILSKHATMPVVAINDGMVVEPDHIYLLPPAKEVQIEGGRLRLSERPPHGTLTLPIDIFLESLARDQGPRGVAVILSGTGSDGSRGLQALKASGGFVIVQEIASAKFDGMPRAAIDTGLADAIIAPEDIPARLTLLLGGMIGPTLSLQAEEERNALHALLALMHERTGIDFADYKPATVQRRIGRRLALTSSPSLVAYLERVRDSPDEAGALLSDLLIGVTRFFRDVEAFDGLDRIVVHEVVAGTPPDGTVRAWVPGCSTGEEAYSVAMLFLRAIEASGKTIDLKVFATDVDRDALSTATDGYYTAEALASVPAELRRRYFRPTADGGGEVTVRLRQSVIFTHHDVSRDVPFTRLDLLSCRNLLIYLEPAVQQRVISTFHFALKPGRFLFLGSSESVGTLATSFAPVDPRAKLFRTVGVVRPTVPTGRPSWRRRQEALRVQPVRANETDHAIERAYGRLVNQFAPPAVLIGEQHELVHILGDPSAYLRMPVGDASLNVLQMLAPALASLVAAGVRRASREHDEVVYSNVHLDEPSSVAAVTLRVRPIESGPGPRHYLIVFESVAGEHHPLAPSSPEAVSADRMQELERQLEYAREGLQSTIEALEAANEELQATNEELVAANEELQATNEELQSVNEELHTVNAEHQSKIEELTLLNADIDNLLRSTGIATLFLDGELAIRKFTPALAAYAHVLPRDIGRPLEHVSLRIEYPGFLEDVRMVLREAVTLEREAKAPNGRTIVVRILPYVAGELRMRGVVVTFIEVTAFQASVDRRQHVVDSLPEQIAVLDPRGRIVMVNESWVKFAQENGAAPGSAWGPGVQYLEVCDHTRGPDEALAKAAGEGLRAVLERRSDAFSLEYPCHSPNERRWFLMHVRPLDQTGGAVVAHIDVTARILRRQETAKGASDE